MTQAGAGRPAPAARGLPPAPRDSISQHAPRPGRRRRAGKMAALVSPLATARCLLRALGRRGRLLPPHRGQCRRRRGSPGLARPGRVTACRGTAQERHGGAVVGAGACLPSPSCRGSVPGGGEVVAAPGGHAAAPGHAHASPLCRDLPVSSHSRPGLVRDPAPQGTCLPGRHRESAPVTG